MCSASVTTRMVCSVWLTTRRWRCRQRSTKLSFENIDQFPQWQKVCFGHPWAQEDNSSDGQVQMDRNNHWWNFKIQKSNQDTRLLLQTWWNNHASKLWLRSRLNPDFDELGLWMGQKLLWSNWTGMYFVSEKIPKLNFKNVKVSKEETHELKLIEPLTNIKFIQCNSYCSFAITMEGLVYSWGYSQYNQIGSQHC